MTWQPGNWLTFKDWAGIIRTGKVRNARRDLLIVTHIDTKPDGDQVRIHEAIVHSQICGDQQAA